MTVNLTNSANLIRPNVQGGIVDLNFRETDLLGWFERRSAVRTNDGGSPYLWNIMNTTTTVAETYVESQGLPVPGQPAYVQASVAAVYQRAVVANTGHIRDQVARGGFAGQDPVAAAIDDATKVLRSLVDTTLAGAVANRGLASIIDATDLYGGIDPAVTTQWASLETNVAGVMTVAVLNTMYRTLTDTPRGAMPDTVLGNINQILNYTNLMGPANALAARTLVPRDQSSPYDLGSAMQSVSFNGAPFVGVRALLNTELYMLDAASGIELLEQRALTVDTLAKVNDDDQMMVSRAWIPIVRNRRRQGKLIGVTA